MNAVDRAVDVALKAARTVSGTLVKYRRDSKEIELTVLIGTSSELTVDDNGVMLQVRTQDILFAVDALDFGSGPEDPLLGDEVSFNANTSALEVWRVCATNDERGYRASDNSNLQWRVHLKRVR